MPSQIDVPTRLQAIAEATLELTRAQGPQAVTVRALAERLGGSTTLVTKYVPSRLALLLNAFRYVDEQWQRDKTEALDGRTGMDGVRALAEWSMQTNNYDDAIRRLWLEALASRPRDVDLPREEAQDEFNVIRRTVLAAGQPPWLADLMFLAFRGYYISSVEDPAAWPPDRAFKALTGVLDLVEEKDRPSSAADKRESEDVDGS